MDRLALLKSRRESAEKSNEKIIAFISGFTDSMSFLDTDRFSQSSDAFGYGAEVVTGYATVAGIPVCVAVQNPDVNKGGFTRAGADKIIRCQQRAMQNGAVMITVIDSMGASLAGGAEVLDAYADVMAMHSSMCGAVPRITVIRGNALGAATYFAKLSDIVITYRGSIAATQSPLAFSDEKSISGSGLLLSGFADFCVQSDAELAALLSKLVSLLDTDAKFEESDLNRVIEKFENSYNSEIICTEIFDNGTFLQFGEGYGNALMFGLAKISGVCAGVILCSDTPNGAELSVSDIQKAAKFVGLLDKIGLPLINFVNCSGTAADSKTDGALISAAAKLFGAVCDHDYAKISVICGSATGFGYMALASKSAGYNSVIAWPDAMISALSPNAGTLAALSGMEKTGDAKKDKSLAEKLYKDSADPFVAAEKLCIDDIIEPRFTRKYILAALTHLL